jgi:NDP-sugar pyrophosphorylase family protein
MRTNLFGELTLEKTGQVKTFEEKQLSAALVNAGFFVMNRNGIIDDADAGETLEEGLLSELCARGLLGAVSFETRWQMMDTPREVEILSNYVLEQNAFWLL